jgi:hypothetical protein
VGACRWSVLLEVLDEGDDECALGEEHARHPLDHGHSLVAHCELQCLHCVVKIGFGGEGRGVEFFQGLGDAFGLCARETPLFEFLDDAVRVDDQCLHTPSSVTARRSSASARTLTVERVFTKCAMATNCV